LTVCRPITSLSGPGQAPPPALAGHRTFPTRVAGDVLHDRHGTLAYQRDRNGLGVDAVARNAAAAWEVIKAALPLNNEPT
jgi:hypothetical protein